MGRESGFLEAELWRGVSCLGGGSDLADSLVFGGSGGIDLLSPLGSPGCEAIHPIRTRAHEDIGAVDGPVVVRLGREDMVRLQVGIIHGVHGGFGGGCVIPVAIEHVTAVGVGFHDFEEI